MLFQRKSDGRGQIHMLSIDSIFPNPAQPRTIFHEEELSNLAESIRLNGLLQPVSVRKLENGTYELISGERRFKATRLLGQEKIKAIILDVDEQQSAILAMIENLQREDLNFFDEARGIFELIYRWKVTQEEAARKLGIAQSTLANKLRILRLSTEIQQIILENGLTERHARALLKIEDQNDQKRIVEEVVKKRLNVAQTEKLITEFQQPIQQKSKRLLIVKDLRIFLNTINRAIDTMKQAGILADVKQSNEGDYVEYTVRIPKQSAYRTIKPRNQPEAKLLKIIG